MKCPVCGTAKTKVRVTNDHGNSVERLRQCETCRTYFKTTEEEDKRGPYMLDVPITQS